MSRPFYLMLSAVIACFGLVSSCCLLSQPVYSRDYCLRPPHMQTTNECNRIPTVAKPYCPTPGY